MVRCVDCGFLTNPQLEEISLEGREHGAMGAAGHTFYSPRCFMMVNIGDELAQIIKDNRAGDESAHYKCHKQLIDRERSCDLFCQWQQGYSPRDHKELTMIQEQRKFEEERREADRHAQNDRIEKDRAFQKQQREDDRQWQEDRRKDDRQWQGKQERLRRTWQAIFVVIAGIIGIAGTLLGKYMTGPTEPPVINFQIPPK